MTRLLWIFSGAIVWALHFTMLYGFTAFACARGLANAVPWVGGIATATSFLAALLILRFNVRRRDEFTGWLTIGVAAFALLAIVLETVPLFTVPICS